MSDVAPAPKARAARAPAKSYKLELPSDVEDDSFMVDDDDEEDFELDESD